MAVLKLPRMPDGAAIVDTKNGKPITALTRAWDAAMSQIEDNLNGILAAQAAADDAQSDADAALAAATAAQADADAALAAAIAAQATADALDAALNVTAGKVLTVLNTMTLAAIDGSTLNIGTGGTLGTAAFTNASDYLPSGASGAFLAKASNLSDVASVPTARTNLGLGTAATQNTGTSGATVPFLNGTNTWAATQFLNGSLFIGSTTPVVSEVLNVAHPAANVRTVFFDNTNAAPGSAIVAQTRFANAAPNNTTASFIVGTDSAVARYFMYSNGGLANYSANNVNLSDASVKGAVERYSETDLDALERFFLKVNWGRYKFLDQTHDDWNHGPTAQGVEEAFALTAPELVDETDLGPDDGKKRKGVYETDLTHIGLALLARGLKRIEAMESKMYAAGIT